MQKILLEAKTFSKANGHLLQLLNKCYPDLDINSTSFHVVRLGAI